jgi:hypothetical protein
MRKWLHDNPWIWIVVFLTTLVAGSVATVIIAEVNKPEIVKPKAARKAHGGSPSSQTAWRLWKVSRAGPGQWLDAPAPVGENGATGGIHGVLPLHIGC